MASLLRRGSWVAIFLTAVGLTGCNLLALPFFILGSEPTVEAGLRKLAADERRKETKVLILTHSALEMKPEFIRVDRDLSERLRAQLKTACEYNKENVKIVSTRQVEEFKSANPGWHTLDFEEIGKQFGADYVVYLELKSLSLYENGSRNTLYRGRAEGSVSVLEVNNPDEGPMRKEFIYQFPSEVRQAIPIEDANLEKFRDAFLNYAAQRLAWQFTGHPRHLEQDCQ